jgi:hypothetical protein
VLRVTVQLPPPTPVLVISYLEQFDQEKPAVEDALRRLVGTYPDNTDLASILLKVVALNDLYSTGILATYQVAEHILDCRIDLAIKEGKLDAVERIARVELGADGKVRNNYSFASKYCAWHNPDEYPVYDRYVDAMLWEYQKLDHFAVFNRGDLRVYDCFKHVVICFRQHYGLASFSFKDLDKFLWKAGREFFPPNENLR